jgi:hypothetical protein
MTSTYDVNQSIARVGQQGLDDAVWLKVRGRTEGTGDIVDRPPASCEPGDTAGNRGVQESVSLQHRFK